MTIKRMVPALALVAMLAVTGCASEETGTAVAGGVAASPAASSQAQDPSAPAPTEESPTEEGPTSESPTIEDPSQSPTQESPTEESPTEESPTEESPTQDSPTVEDPSQSPTEESPEMGGNETAAPTTAEESPTEEAPEGGGVPADVCDLMPAEFSKGKTKDDSRDPAVTCTYVNETDGYKSASMTTGFAPDDASIKQDYNIDVEELEIDGRPGYTYFYGKDRTLAVATYALADERSGLQCSIQDDTMKPAELTEAVTAMCTAASKKLPKS